MGGEVQGIAVGAALRPLRDTTLERSVPSVAIQGSVDANAR